MYSIYSYGSPRFSLGDQSVHFSAKNPAGKIWFEPVEEEFETLSGDIISVFKGWRAYASLLLYNLRDVDAQSHLKLIHIINASKAAGQPILLQPRYCAAASLNLYVVLEGNFGYNELGLVQAGQSLELQFKSQRLLTELPAIVNLPGYLKISATGYLLLDASGSRLILPAGKYIEIDTTAHETIVAAN